MANYSLISSQIITQESCMLLGSAMKDAGIETTSVPLRSNLFSQPPVDIKEIPQVCRAEHYLEFQHQDLMLSIDTFGERFLRRPCEQIAVWMAERAPKGKVVTMTEIELPGSIESAERCADRKDGVIIQFFRWYDGVNNVMLAKLEIAYEVRTRRMTPAEAWREGSLNDKSRWGFNWWQDEIVPVTQVIP